MFTPSRLRAAMRSYLTSPARIGRNQLRQACHEMRLDEYAQARQRGAGWLLAHVYSWARTRPIDWPWCWLPLQAPDSRLERHPHG